MSDSTPSTDPNTLLFPAFLYGDHATCRRRWKAEGKKWGKRYLERGDFLEPKLIPVQPGSVIWTDDSAAQMLMLGSHERRKDPNWHFYLLHYVPSEASPGDFTNDSFYLAYDAFACRYSWGALSLLIHQHLYISVARVAQRLEAVLSFWEQLNTVRYIDRYLEEYDLTKLLTLYTYDMMLTWADAPVGRGVREVLREMIERMHNASEDEIHARIIRRLYQLIDADPNLKRREWLKSPGLVEAELAHSKETELDVYEDLRIGRNGIHSGFLTRLQEKYPTG